MALRNVRVFVSILVIAVAAACGGGEAPSEPMSAEPTGPPATPLDPATAGNVTAWWCSKARRLTRSGSA